MINKSKWIGFIIFISLLSCTENEKQDSTGNNKNEDGDQNESIIGKTLPAWEDGYLDIHAINTGRGESALLILPDGTTMLIDAAGSLISPTAEIPPPPQKPNVNVSPGLTITNYIKKFIKTASNKLNYIMLSHFHPDHMGSYDTDLPLNPSGGFRIGGVTEVGANIAFDKIIDRGYPDYDFPTDMTSDPMMANYIKFIEWAKDSYGATAERFNVGEVGQIVLKQNPLKYSNFQIRNIAANGKVWTGTGTEIRNTLPEGEDLLSANPPENIFSIGLVLSYGKFDYFTAGDLQYNGRSTDYWKDMEAPVAKVVASVDVMKANHHGTANCNGDELLQSLKPNVVVTHTWRDIHPNPETLGRIYNAQSSSKVFTTNLTFDNRQRLGAYLSKIKSTQGHIVVRVEPGGGKYSIYILDDSNQNYKVTQFFGPYESN
ncbi:ComEC/Rec2 family competence protein [Wenyingzhuangia sp. 2_MG-2023]|uniref:ComEC/Rec2 family competence protein n=1 Tax=Wenyingzhuangia sp. 2_MG-2023 TaxID=3062639 RepID=UPI0026E15C93|nr:MBL fold metallo-hydrolase [Wenyingzhuangia sp. 2_MG-2023]MDO6738205.1 MBL fold metallo-hydrolase [Wenyingzhuangia sp. 2_MG-2023]